MRASLALVLVSWVWSSHALLQPQPLRRGLMARAMPPTNTVAMSAMDTDDDSAAATANAGGAARKWHGHLRSACRRGLPALAAASPLPAMAADGNNAVVSSVGTGLKWGAETVGGVLSR